MAKAKKLSKPLQDYHDYVMGLEQSNIPYTVEFSGSIKKVTTSFTTRSFVLRNYSNKGELNLIKKVKKYVLENNIQDNFPVITEKNIKYFDLNKKLLGTTVEKPIEIDLSSAYWETAYMLNIISKELYQDGLKVSKSTRLTALGSLAKITSVYDWVNGNYSDIRDLGKANGEASTRHLFFHISKRVDELMQRCQKKLGKDFMFYWVDAIFFHSPKHIPVINEMIAEAGYACKPVNNEFARFREKDALVYSKEKGLKSKKHKDLKVRLFNYEA